jgi:lipopolysaccharide export system ATP-binding protein
MEEENTQQQTTTDVSENIEQNASQEQEREETPQAYEETVVSSTEPNYDNLSPEQVDELLKEKLPRQELHTQGLVKRYGRRTVADHVSFNVKQGEIVGLLGPNGAGKTTSFYMTTGLIIPNEGHVYIDDKEITDYPVYKRARAGIGYLPQEASVFRKMSVEDNIMAVLEMTKLTHQQQLDKLESLIAEFRLQKVRKNKGDRLSGGERRRTEIARCLAIDPKFIMLDEPFAGVDPIAVEDIQHIVWRLKYRNIGILITDHNVQETLSITDRAYLLFEGRILFQGLPEELAENKIVRKNYLSDNFVYRKFQSNEDDRAFAAQARKQLLKEISK